MPLVQLLVLWRLYITYKTVAWCYRYTSPVKANSEKSIKTGKLFSIWCQRIWFERDISICILWKDKEMEQKTLSVWNFARKIAFVLLRNLILVMLDKFVKDWSLTNSCPVPSLVLKVILPVILAHIQICFMNFEIHHRNFKEDFRACNK